LPKRDIIVIGGSAGSLLPLRETLANLPPEFPAAIFVVIHIGEDSPGLLAAQLSDCSALPVEYPADREGIQRGQIYLARSDHHLTIEDGRIRVQSRPFSLPCRTHLRDS
jgi:two-component system chemotaxis response regulator CheB